MPPDELTLQNGEPQVDVEPREPQTDQPPPEPKPKPVDAEPPPDHPRFKEIYGKMKHYERQLAETDDKYKALLEHNEKLNQSIGVLVDKMDVQQRPDPVSEPEKYEAWIIQRAKRELEREFKPEPKIAVPEPTYNRPEPQINAERQEQIRYQIAAMEAAYDDYTDMVSLAERDMGNDPVLRNEIWSAPNPAKKAYQYAKQKLERAQQEKQQMNTQTFTESPSQGQPPPTQGLDEEQRRAAQKLGIGEEAYSKQIQAMKKAGIYRG